MEVVAAAKYLTEWYWALVMLGVLAGVGYLAYTRLPFFKDEVDEARENVRKDVEDILRDPRD